MGALVAGPGGGMSAPTGLSGLTEACLGRPLDKRQRMTNWEDRPLTSEQINYAAMDAKVLIDIHKVRFTLSAR
jgi:ribonuclease D